MSVSLPVRSHPSHAEDSYSREDVIAAIQDFYELLIKLPYIPPTALLLPPKEGWPGVNIQELQRRGKTEEVIYFLRHLPYLRGPEPRKQWMIGPDTVEIAYCDGELYKEWMEELQPVPAHCVLLTELDARGGLSLVFDTKTGTITELSNMCQKVMLDSKAYENLPLQDQWMAHATTPATDLFRLWKRRFEKLFWMALYNPRAQGWIAEWYTFEDEEDLLASDDDYDPEGEKTENVDEGWKESDSEDGMNNEDKQILEEEVDGLMDDAGDDSYQKRMELRAQQNIVESEPFDLSHLNPTDQPPNRRANFERSREISLLPPSCDTWQNLQEELEQFLG